MGAKVHRKGTGGGSQASERRHRPADREGKEGGGPKGEVGGQASEGGLSAHPRHGRDERMARPPHRAPYAPGAAVGRRSAAADDRRDLSGADARLAGETPSGADAGDDYPRVREPV